MRNKLLSFLLILLFPFAFNVYGQKQVNSPFSRFNIGSLEPAGSFKSQGMGGVSLGLRDNSSIFFTNPASYSSLDTNSFIFDFGVDYSMNKLTDGSSEYTSDDMNFDHMIMGFPIGKNWGVGVGIVPLSNGYYNMTETLANSGGNYTATHKGNGGMNSLFVGTGVKVFKNFSAGVNMTVLFGQIDRQNDFIFDDLYNSFNNGSTENLQLSGINFDYGIQYTLPIKKNYFLNAGASLTAGKRYKSSYTNFVYKYTSFGTVDTMSYVDNSSGSFLIPGTFRAGLAFGKVNVLTIGIDYVRSNWSESDIPGSTGFAADSKMYLAGIEYTPDKFANFGFLKRVDYRMGFHGGDNYLIIDGKQVKEKGASFGVGIPLRKTHSKANFFVDFTRKSASAASLKREDYITFGASINLYDWPWFYKRRYE